ncbi:MAG: ACT domain-containing protein [Clostridiales bacterium]|nr:ACT domain-containing protein [Clostridiales bacterium]
MLKGYLIVEKSALPDYFIKVVEARNLLESGAYTQVIDAVQAVGISRSTYYKYKDKILEPSQLTVGRKASLIMHLSHEAGMLSRVLSALSNCNANILTITQSLPIHGKASIMLSIDLGQMNTQLEQMIADLKAIDGVENVRLLALE